MVEIKIDSENKAPMLIAMSGSSVECAKEVSIVLVEVCKAISKVTGDPFDNVFASIVGGAKLMRFFEKKEGGRQWKITNGTE